MPKSDVWPGGIAMESLSNMDSAGSQESVISMNSGYSEDSMEHLSAEERACLMYLEETIEALEVQEDSGYSNDEPDAGIQAGKLSRTKYKDLSSLTSDEFGGAEPLTQRKPPGTKNKVLRVTKDEKGNPVIVTGGCLQPGHSSDIDAALIPPPSDFMDEPRPRSLLQKAKDLPPSSGISQNKSGTAIDLEELRQRATGKRSSVSSSIIPESLNTPPSEVAPGPSPTAVTSGLQVTPPPPPSPPPPEAAEPRSPPTVAPKPKKLPANIFLKSHKSPVAGADVNSGHSVPSGSASMDQQRIRMEALRKLGLLKVEESDSVPALSPKMSPRNRASWGALPSPISPAATPPMTPSNIYVSSPPPDSAPPQPHATVTPAAPDVLPAPSAFSDSGADYVPSPVKGFQDVKASTPSLTPPTLIKHLTPPKNVGFKSATLERSGPGLSSRMAGQDFVEDALGVNGERSPRQLRNARPRPASLGSRNEFSTNQVEGLQRGHAQGASPVPELRRLSAPVHSRDSHKLPRAEGISVLICPRSENDEDRRSALRKLGLLRD